MIHYLIQLTLFWVASAIVFELFLKKLTMHRINRFWLIATAVLGFVWPIFLEKISGFVAAVELPVFELPTVKIGQNLNQNGENLPEKMTIFNFWNAVLGSYFVGLSFGISVFLRGIWQLSLLIFNEKSTSISGGFQLFLNEKIAQPCSFFRWIFLPKSLNINDLNTKSIIAHEQAHGRLGHSFDVLFFEILRLTLWFHPLAWWFKMRLRDVHEFEADDIAARLSTKKQYGLLLLQSLDGVATQNRQIACSNSFFSSPVKNRIFMLTQQKSSRISGLRYFLALPILVFLMLFSQKNSFAQTVSAKYDRWMMQTEIDTIVTFDPVTYKETVEFVKFGKPIKTTFTSGQFFYKEVDEMPEYVGGPTEMMEFIFTNLKYPKESREMGISGKVFVQFIVEIDGSLSSFQAAKTPPNGFLYQESERVLASMPRWKPGKIDGKPVRTMMIVPIKFALD
jgi:Gram-negative bacterial TonB protein C-terminal/BlaR1 peptidase M56